MPNGGEQRMRELTMIKALLGWAMFCALGTLVCRAEAADPVPLAARLRRPIAVQLSADARHLWIANRCGSLSCIELDTQSVASECDLGQQFSDAVWLAPGRLLVTDEADHALLLIETDGVQCRVAGRTAVSPYPVAILAGPDGQSCYVTSLWSQRLSRVAVAPDGQLAVDQVLDLPFAPRKLTYAPSDTRLIVADAFAGRLALIDRAALTIEQIRHFPGHNIRGLERSNNDRMLVVSHQMLNELAHAMRNDVHWGLLMSNDLRWLNFESLFDPDKDLYTAGHMHPLGEAGSAAGDPAGVAMAADGTVVVCLSGVNQVAMGKENDFSLYRLPVGRRPTAVAISPDSRRAYVANTFGDSVSVVDLAQREAVAEISLGPQRDLSSAEKGELLFYNAEMSHDGWMSCHSCHTDGHANGGLNDNLSDGNFGAAKRVLSLLGVADTAPFAWTGGVASLEQQITNSFSSTMQLDRKLSDEQVQNVVAFLQTLEVPPSVTALRGEEDPQAIARGAAHFRRLGCANCHAPPLYTTPDVYDVGLVDREKNRLFNPPSLRGLSQRGPYFHDNRAESLEDVFRVHKHQLEGEPLTEDELRDLLALLRSL